MASLTDVWNKHRFQNGFVNYYVVTNDIVNEIVAMGYKVLSYLESWRLICIIITINKVVHTH